MIEETIDWKSIKRILAIRRYRGIGDSFRRCSQYILMKNWEWKYKFTSALESPYDESTGGVDGGILNCPYTASTDITKVPSKTFDFVWNFGFIQRQPSLIFEMKRVARRYIAAFVPNCLNPGMLIHKLYHWIYEKKCTHPERGDPRLMRLTGLLRWFEYAGFDILESGYIDIPPWPATVVTIKQFFGRKSWEPIDLKVDIRPLLAFEKIAWPKSVLAHHLYVLGRIEYAF
jgi:hypothetical protein